MADWPSALVISWRLDAVPDAGRWKGGTGGGNGDTARPCGPRSILADLASKWAEQNLVVPGRDYHAGASRDGAMTLLSAWHYHHKVMM